MSHRDDRSEEPRVDLLDVLATGEPPAFATTQHHRITFWNSGAARVLGRRAEEVLGAHCHEVLQGRDLFGNLFCYENCPLVATARRGEPVSQCEFTVTPPDDERKTLAVTTLHVPGSRPEVFTLIHVLQPLTSSDRLLKMIEDGLGQPQPAHSNGHVQGNGHAAGNGNGNGNGSWNAYGNGNGNGNGNGKGYAAPVERPPLTNREQEILKQVASGLQNKEIAQALGISLATVRNHVHNILDKLGVHSKLEAVCLAFRSGWVESGQGGSAGPNVEA
jgi:DNA-binding CsgD family transcriptional regulator